ncbi:MAG: ribosome-associated translation inhibitor RaiA [Nitrospira sp.]|jgi:putative sigma-54 modulation protein|uniref:ribosome hibernation-promoting factor, HPF/YfiA family n=1 Tax=Nitrospira sp. ND1 TaxID=1658518 RepID=UPI0009B98C5B|nr:ribosome-associated translation inhibitor RaiA [Nitrospira sp. ND1]MBK7419529.1 ribosome-associated translation inhibitor RaiA [Nitrospira sp.]OYT24249.1 MAG: ribosomal subunit interface protein [Nitrospira sp. UW-LDO-02]MBK8378587.1 ribosome-associated translation inhibitor RaiA [Nitrospira sp.]MBK9111037.1 ribosome-associated translation inhibitor RaiA [Nitrospira sp.]MBP6200935.1 ribosome-associated translation inhibitor RaiA [Nitrospira sp.]
MRLMITGRHVAVTPALREYIETRMERLDRYGLKLGTLQILLSVEKFHHVAEVVGVVQSRRLQAKTSTEEMYASIDEVVDKLGAQLRKLKERKVNHKFGDQPRVRAVARKAPRAARNEVEVVRPTLEVLTVEEAVEALNSAKLAVLVFVNALSGTVQVLQRLPNGRVSLIDPTSDRARTAHGRA